MKRSLVFPLSGAAALLAMATLAPPAEARGVPASAGHATWASDAACFSPWYEAETNYCSTARGYTVPLVVDTAGNYGVTVTAYGASASNTVGCQALGVDKNITSVWGSSMNYLPTFGAPADITLTGAYVPPGGVLFANCQVNGGGRIDAVNWGQASNTAYTTEVDCETGPKSGDQLCQGLGFAGATIAEGYWWGQCAGTGDRCPSGWGGPNGTSCVGGWSSGMDCVGWSFVNPPAPYNSLWQVHDLPGNGATVFDPQQYEVCAGWNPGWTVRVVCHY